jgi:hypothetical protein
MKKALIWLAALAAAPAWSQDAACPHASEVAQAQMLGLWRAELEGSGHVGSLLLEKHALYAQSLSGWINRNGERRQVAGDVEDGEFTLEESADGVRIAAAWVGELVEGSCGKEVRGTWTIDGEKSGKSFVLRKE